MFVNLNTCHAAQDFKVVTDNTGLAAHDLPTIKISLVHGLMLIWTPRLVSHSVTGLRDAW